MSTVQKELQYELTVTGLVKEFGGVRAIDGVDIAVPTGQIMGLIGPNGAGKTTFINAISGFVKPTAGHVQLGDRSVTGWAPARMCRAGLSRTFQHARRFPTLTGRQALIAAGNRASAIGGLVSSHRRERDLALLAEEILERLALTPWGATTCESMPYGIAKRLGIGMALMREPRVLLLDEPAAGLNSEEAAELVSTLKGLRSSGQTLLLVEHNMALIMEVSDHLVVLDSGRKLTEGRPAEVVADPRVTGAYLGRR